MPRSFLFFGKAQKRKANLMAVIVIFVEGADTEPDPLPVYILDNQDHATLICEGLKESEYRIFNFSMRHCTRSDRGRFAVWAKMVIDARDGVYGSNAAGIYNMIDEAHAIISQRRTHQEPVANPDENTHSNGDSIEPSSKPENQGETDDNPGTALARQQLRPYVEITKFREYLKEQILKWETWHQSQVDEIRKHESWLDHDKEQLEHIRQGTGDPDDPDNTYVGSDEWHKDEVASIRENLEFRLVAEREPVCFEEVSIAAIVAMFWCDINRSSLLVPDYDFLEPYGPFSKYLSEQWKKPIQGRYKHIHWFVEAAIKKYESRIANDGVDAAISLRMSDIAATELKSDQQSNQKPSEIETAGLETVTTADIGTKNSTNPKEQEVSLCETATVAQPSEVLKEHSDAPKQGATESEQDAALKPIDKAKVERNDWLLEMRGKNHSPKMTETELSNELLKECENKPNWVPIEPRSISAALREAYTRQTGNLWPFDGRGRQKKTGK